MQFTAVELPGPMLIEPRVFADNRGYFYESFNEREFVKAVPGAAQFVQDDHSLSGRGVLRGLHYQLGQPQGKIVRVTSGAVFDVIVDIRRQSSAFGRWWSTELSSENRRMLWIPPGFAHGFLALSDKTEVLYKVTDYWAPQHQRTIKWDDSDLKIEWPLEVVGGRPTVSAKDAEGVAFATAECF